MGWLLLATGVGLPLAATGYLWSHAAADGADLPAADWAAWLDGWPWTLALTLVPAVGLQLFPDGRPAGRRWRPALWLGWAVVAAQLLNELFAPTLLDWPDRTNPTALPGPAGAVADALGASIVLVPVLATLSAWSVQRRSRRAVPGTPGAAALRLVRPAGWVVAASWWACGVAVVTTGDSDTALALEVIGPAVLAATAWLAIRRHGWFDARQVLSRAVLYATLSALVLLVYLAAGAGLGLVATDRVGGALAVVAAVLVAVPLRDALQRLANRLVHGYRDDPAGALARLSGRLEGAAAADVLPAVADTVRQALRLPHVSIRVGGRTVAAGGPVPDTEEFPLVFAGETIGALLAGRREPGRPLGPEERRLLDGLAGQVAAAGHAVTLTEDLRRSRERLVSATEEERRRIRRDLHDGLGPTLAGLVLGLGQARRVADDPEAARARIDRLTEQTQAAVAEVRRLVYALRPPALDELGLLGALDEHARGLGGITVHGPDEPLVLPAAVEVAAYRIALEAMTNVVRHASARSASVRLALGGALDAALHLEVSDDGAGLPDRFRAGVGIASMRERAAELGGSCTIEPLAPHGTLVRAVLPVRPA